MNAVLAGCSRRKRQGAPQVAALDLYEGGCVPALRSYVDARPRGRAGVFLLSARYGLLEADSVVSPYDQALDLPTAERLRSPVGRELERALRRLHAEEIVVLAEPLYLLLCADVLAAPGRPAVHWFADPAADFPRAVAVFERWGWG
jgi:hypothetical protein